MNPYVSNQFPIRAVPIQKKYALFEAGNPITEPTTDYSRLVALKKAKWNNGCRRLQIRPV